MIFIFLSYREKAHDNKEFSRENSKPGRESQITLSRTMSVVYDIENVISEGKSLMEIVIFH